MTIQSNTGFTQIETDSGTATITASKPNISIKGAGGATTTATGSEILINAGGSGGTGEVEGFINLGFSYNTSTGVFTIHSADGTDLNSDNGSVRLWQGSPNSGLNKAYIIDQNFRFIDSSGTSQINNNLFGKNSGGNWNRDMPMFIYAVANAANDDVWFAICRTPWEVKSSPASSSGSAVSSTADQERSFFFFQKWDGSTWINPVLTDFSETPCRALGNFTVRTSGTNDWKVQPLKIPNTMGTLNPSQVYIFPTGLFGAPSGQHFVSSSGTAPLWGASDWNYWLSSDGHFWGRAAFAGSTMGTLTSITNVTFPFNLFPLDKIIGMGVFRIQNTLEIETLHISKSNSNNWFKFHPVKDTATTIVKLNTQWPSEGSNRVSFHFWGKVPLNT